MEAQGLDGNFYPIKYKNRKSRKRSSHVQEAFDLIKKVSPGLHVCEEAAIKIRRGQTQYLDLLIPLLWIAFEVHGKQHFEYTPHFHNNQKANFFRGQRRDTEKREWCELNNIILVELAYDRKQEWEQLIKRQIKPLSR